MVTDQDVERYREEARKERAAAVREWRMAKLVEMLERSEGATRSELLRNGRIKASEIDSLLAELNAAGRITTSTTINGGRPKTIIKMIGR